MYLLLIFTIILMSSHFQQIYKEKQKEKESFNLKALYLSKFYTQKLDRTPLQKVKNIQNIISQQVNKNKNKSGTSHSEKQLSTYKVIVYDPFLTSPQKMQSECKQQKPKTAYSPEKYGLENMSRRLAKKKKTDIIKASSFSASSPRQRFIKSSQTHRVRIQMNKNYIKWFHPEPQSDQMTIKNSNCKQAAIKYRKQQQNFIENKPLLQCKYEYNKKSPENYFRKQLFPSKKVIIANSNLGEEEQKYINQYKRMHKLIEEEGKMKLLKLSDKRIIHGKTHNFIDIGNRKQIRTQRGYRQKDFEKKQSPIMTSLRVSKNKQLKKTKNQSNNYAQTNQFQWFTNPQIKKVTKTQKREQKSKQDHLTQSIQPWNVKQIEDICEQSKRLQ